MKKNISSPVSAARRSRVSGAAMPKRRSKAAFDRTGHAVARASRVEKSGSFAESYLSYLLARASHTVASGFHA
jgi:hypothetical protein